VCGELAAFICADDAAEVGTIVHRQRMIGGEKPR
jgi:hypothetical protein